jgi:D-cysteine desulfhydrase
MDRLGAAIGFREGALWIKRDDLTGLAGGGNKARKLEYIVGDAMAAGCDVLLTGGAAQSNHVRMTAAAARIAGMECVAVMGGEPREVLDGNLLLDRVLGAELVWAGTYDAELLETTMAETCMRLTSEGRQPYEIPLGGASDVGTLGYVAAAGEIMAQAPMGSILYTATGSGGTQAGLVVGFGNHERVRGVDVGAIPDVADRIASLIAATSSLAGRPLPDGHVQLDTAHVGDGYGVPTDGAREAIELCATLEGVLLDPVYSAKAMAALIADRRSGRLPAGQLTVFVHTGGLPSLFADRFRAWLTV